MEPPKIVVNNFAPPQLKLTAGGARPQLVHTGDFTPDRQFADSDR